jgi:hypothetical protein
VTSQSSTDTYGWTNVYGGMWGSASNWTDVTTGTAASVAPNASSSVTVTGGTNYNYTVLEGLGAAAQLAIANDVLLWGTVAVGGTVTLAAGADLDLDGGSTLSAGGLNLASNAILEVSSSSVIVSGAATLRAGFLLASNGSVMQFGALVANSASSVYPFTSGLIAVDDNSSIEVGTAGGAAP